MLSLTSFPKKKLISHTFEGALKFSAQSVIWFESYRDQYVFVL